MEIERERGEYKEGKHVHQLLSLLHALCIVDVEYCYI